MIHFWPDSREHAPQVLTSIVNVLPNRDGSWRSPYAEESTGYTSVGSFSPMEAYLGVRPSGSSRLYAASNTVIMEADGPFTWTSRGTFTAANTGWTFCQVGDATVAASIENTLQKSTATGAFTQLNSTIKAQSVATLEGALAAWNIVDSGTAKQDGLAISDIGDITNFTPSTTFATLAYKTTLTDVPGPGTAIIAFRDMLCIFKQRGFWVAQFVDSPLIWDVRLVSQDVGCYTPWSCVVAGDKLYFCDDNDIYQFDGSQIISIAGKVRQYLLTGDFQLAAGLTLAYDDVNNHVIFYCRGSTTGAVNEIWQYCPDTGEWGHQDGIGASGSVYTPVRCTKQQARDFVGGVTFRTQNRLCMALNGSSRAILINSLTPSASSSATTALFGDFDQESELERVAFDATTFTGTVQAASYRGPSTSTSAQGSQAATTISNLIGDLKIRGNYFLLTLAATAITAWNDMFLTPEMRGRK